MKKPTLCIIFGGKSSEYEVSLRSAFGVLSHLDYEKYNVITIGITKGGEWYIYEGEKERILTDTWQGKGCVPVTVNLSNGHLIVLDKDVYAEEVDVFFPIMHGELVEDGRLQGLFDICGVKYVGCDSFSSHICMDKRLAKSVAQSLGIKVAREYSENDEIAYPVFVKPCMCGSSVGVSRVENASNLKEAVCKAKEYCPNVMIEEQISGCEVEVAVLECGGELTVSPVGMVHHSGVFYGYEEKYHCENNRYIIPAPIDKSVAKTLQEHAKKLFLALGCRGIARFDFFVNESGVVFNEVNTMPGFTEASMYPMLMSAAGVSYGELIDKLIVN